MTYTERITIALAMLSIAAVAAMLLLAATGVPT